MGTKIVKPEVQLIPKLDERSLSLALSELTDELKVIPDLKAKAAALKVTNAVEYAEAGALRADVRSRRKIPRFKLSPFQEVAKRVVDFLRTKHSEAEQAFDSIDIEITAKMDAHARQERLAAEAEQRRINEERRVAAEKAAAEQRKAAEAQAEADRKQREKEIEAARKAGEVGKREAERLKKEAEEKAAREKKAAAVEQALAKEQVETVTVKPNLPTIAGSRRRVTYQFEVVNDDALINAFATDIEKRILLRRFIQLNEQEVGRYIRDTKNVEEATKMLQGAVRVWEDDRT